MKTVEGVKLTKRNISLLLEARRRYVNFAIRDNKSIADAWLGLGMASTYAPAVKSGIMESVGVYAPRCLGWFKLTPLGVKVFAAWLATETEATL